MDSLRRRKTDKTVILGFSRGENKIIMNMAASKDLVSKGFSCKQACLRIAQGLGGSGGGRDDFGFAGAKEGPKFSLDRLNKQASDIIRDMVRP